MSLDFNGTTSVVTADITAVDTGDWTQGAWVYPDSVGEINLGCIQNSETPGQLYRTHLLYDSSTTRKWYCEQQFSTTDARAYSATLLPLNQWSCVFAKYTDSDKKIYLYIGDLDSPVAEVTYNEAQVAGVGTRGTGATKWTVGSRLDTAITWDGAISRPFFDNRAWTTDEMEMFRQGHIPVNTTTNTLRVFFPLDSANNTTTIKDLSGNNAHATNIASVSYREDPPISVSPFHQSYTAAPSPPIIDDLPDLTITTTTTVDIHGMSIPIPAPSNILIVPDQIGAGEWRAIIQHRGGGAYIGELTYTSLSMNRVLSDAADASITISASDLIHSECCDVIKSFVPYKYELVLYRNQQSVYVGPIIEASFTRSSVTLESFDLFHWFEKRIINVPMIERYTDLAEAFETLYNIGIGQDPSPNIKFMKRDTGVKGGKEVNSEEWRRVADDMKELAESGLHFVVLDRVLYCFGNDDRPFPDLPVLISEDFGDDLTFTMNGADFANDVIVTGNTDEATGFARYGHKTSWNSTSDDPLITQVFSESNNVSEGALDLSAMRRLDTFKRPPLTPTGTFSSHANLPFNRLLPGCHAPMALITGCVEVIDTFMLTRVEVSVELGQGVTESITPTFQPIVKYTTD